MARQHTHRHPRPVAIVTGAATGIGRAVAVELTGAGFTVVGTSRKPAVAATAGGALLQLDVTDDASVRALVEQVVERYGRIDVLVNNAGLGLAAPAEESSVAQARQLFEVNVFGVLRMIAAVAPHMRAAGSGRIITVSSALGVIPAPFMALYAATKHAVEGYSESLDHELRTHGVRAVLVEPAYVRSGFEANALAGDTPLAAYDEDRRVALEGIAAAMRSADEPDVVAEVVRIAATVDRPRVRYTAGRTAAAAGLLRRLAPASVFDAQIRKISGLPPAKPARRRGAARRMEL